MNIDTVLLRIRKCLAVRGTTVAEIIGEYQHQKSSELTIVTFDRMLLSLGASLGQPDMQLLKEAFGNGKTVSIQKFTEAVENTTEMKMQPADCDNELLALQKQLTLHRTDLLEIMRPYDRMRRGVISSSNFLSAVGNSPYARVIAGKFERSDDGMIHFYDIADAFETLANAKPVIVERPAVVDAISKRASDASIDLRGALTDRDRVRVGVLDEGPFVNVLASNAIHLTPDERRSLVEYYVRDGRIDYLRFVQDHEQIAASSRKKVEAVTTLVYNLDEIVQMIRVEFARRRIKVADAFIDLEDDVTTYAFVKTLLGSGIVVRVDELEFVASHFANEQRVVDVSAFLEMCGEQAPIRVGLDVKGVIDKIREYLAVKRCRIAPRLRKCDREDTGEVPFDLAISSIALVGLDLGREEVASLAVAFPGSRRGFIKWHELVAAVDPEMSSCTFSASGGSDHGADNSPSPSGRGLDRSSMASLGFGSDKSGPAVAPAGIAVPDDIISVLREIRRAADERHIVLMDEMRPRDRARVGVITGFNVMAIMRMLFPRISALLVQKVIDFYGGDEVNYFRLCDDVRESPSMTCTLTTQATSAADEEAHRVLVRKIKAFLLRQMIGPNDVFKGEDPQKCGYIRVERVQSCFHTVRLPLTEKEVAVLVAIYRNTGYPERFDYHQLCAAVDASVVKPEEVEWVLEPEKALADQQSNVHRALVEIREKSNARRKSLVAMFTGCEERVPVQFFRDRLMNIGFLIPETAVRVILWKYADDTGVDWRGFCKDTMSAVLI